MICQVQDAEHLMSIPLENLDSFHATAMTCQHKMMRAQQKMKILSFMSMAGLQLPFIQIKPFRAQAGRRAPSSKSFSMFHRARLPGHSLVSQKIQLYPELKEHHLKFLKLTIRSQIRPNPIYQTVLTKHSLKNQPASMKYSLHLCYCLGSAGYYPKNMEIMHKMNTNSQKSIKRNREKTPRGNFFTLLPLLAISCLFFIVLLTDKGLAFPPPAAEYYGTVVNKLGASFPAGTNVSFYDADGVLCGQYNVTSTGYYGFLSCNGDDPDTAVDEGADEGDALSFLINNETAGTLNDSVFYLDINASDPDNDTLQYSLIVSPAFASLTLNSSTGVINTTPDNDDVGVYYVRIIVSDGSLSDYEDIQLRVLNTNDAPYFLQNLTNQTVYEGNATNYDINCSDDDIDYGDSISYSLNVSKITISSSSGLITWTPLHNDTGLYTINATCSDGESTSSQTFNIEVVDINNAPVLTGIGDQSVYSDAI